MKSILNEARRAGAEQRKSTSILVRLAFAAVQGVLAGEVGPEDAADIYNTYALAAGLKGQDASSSKAQASKLRQLMKLAEERPKSVIELLERVIRLHEAAEVEPKQLFEAAIDVARAQLRQRTLLRDAEIIKLMTKPPPKKKKPAAKKVTRRGKM